MDMRMGKNNIRIVRLLPAAGIPDEQEGALGFFPCSNSIAGTSSLFPALHDENGERWNDKKVPQA